MNWDNATEVTTSDPLEDIKAAIEQWKNAPMPDPTRVVSRDLYELHKRFYETRRDYGST